MTWSGFWFQSVIQQVRTAPIGFDLTSHEECGALSNNPTGEQNTEDENEGDDLKKNHLKPVNTLSHLENLGSCVRPLGNCLH